MSYKAKLDDKLVDQFLGIFLCQHAVFQVTLNINIKESGSTSKGCSRTVVFFYTGKISHIDRLDRLFGIGCRFRDVHSVGSSHFFDCS